MFKALAHAPSVPSGGRELLLLIASLLLWSCFVPSSCAQAANPNHKNDPTDCTKAGARSTGNQLADLHPDESIPLLCLAGVHGRALEVGDKLAGKFCCASMTSDCGHQNELKRTATSATAPADDTHSGVSGEPATAADEITKDLTICLSTTESEPSGPISEVRSSNSGSAGGNSFSSVLDKVFTGKSCDSKVVRLEAFISGGPSPVFQDLAYTSAETVRVSTPAPASSSILLQQLPLP